MKSKISVVFLMFFFISTYAITTWTQAEKSEPQLWFFAHNVIKPSMMNKFEAYVKKMADYSKQHNYEYLWYSLLTDDYHYYCAVPVKDKNDIDRMLKTWGELGEDVGKAWQDMMKDYWNCYESTSQFLIRHRPDLSYNPEKVAKEEEDYNFFVWHIDYVIPGKQAEYEAIYKEWVEMNTRTNSNTSYNLYAGELGLEGPLYIGMARGKNIYQWYENFEKFWETAGKEGQERQIRRRDLIRKHETKHLWYRPDLSFEFEKK